uniref:Regulatory protein zeste n=1 Tax=Glossina brevipalpis TaxID=37001 RepID=A0A1A9WCY8_9MUSC
MVLRSGIILPFQFRDTKKLLMIGVPEENRDLSIWDLKNVVRAAFGIYNFEFRNKKIGFNIPDELLLQYLAQRHDLTNFVIEIGQGNDDTALNLKDQISYEPSCSQKLSIPLPQKSNDSLTNDSAMMATQIQQMYGSNSNAISTGGLIQRSRTPLDGMENHSNHSSNLEPAHRIRVLQVYNENTPESLTQSIDPMDIIPKSEQDETELSETQEMRYNRHQHHEQQQQQQQQDMQPQIHHQEQQATETQMQQPPQLQQQQQQSISQHFMPNYGHHASIITNQGNTAVTNPPSSPLPPGLQIQPPPPTPHISHASNQQSQTQYSPAMMNRFRRRGERMSKDQKELYVKFFEENPCMFTQRRNDVMLEPLWNKLANLLNSVPQGAVKNVEEWKQTFDAWRYRVFMYTRYNTKLSGAAAQNPKNYKPLTPTDQRAYAMWTSHKSTAPPDFDGKIEMFIFDPCKDNYHTLISNCVSCRCGSTQKQALDLHEPSKNTHSNISHTTGVASVSQQAAHQQHHQQTLSSASNSQHSQSGPEEPPLKLRITNVNTLPSSTIAGSNNESCNESEQIEIEPKIDYDELPSPSSPMHPNSVVQQQQQQQHPTTSTALALTSTPTMALASGALKMQHNNPDTDEETSYMEREFQEQELHLERMHEYFIQQQHLQHQQQHQHQSHLEALMQESSSSNSLRQRKERMSKKQKEFYVNFLEQNPIINEHRRNDPALNRYWLKLADVLNSVPQGAVKHVAEWKQTFDNWRYRVFLYARYNSKISGEEALNPKCFKPLTMTDKRAYNIWIRNPDTAPPDLEHMRNVFMNLEEAPLE